MTDVEVVAGPGSVERLADLVAGFAPRRVLVVGSPTAVARTGIARRLTGYQLELFGDFTPDGLETTVGADDFLNCGAGTDFADGGPGTDTGVSCESAINVEILM